ncbi:SMI1/KNR4 family protein [Pyxidicoccus parkwayensis]|uniref:SMI1/KNR4 family protein n=1 Tax=Pyxidicoccus parkwayensis TaxID=2813578 RepID=A0ABX7NJ29_9BACT|nr:SMI1/KNR4 family protein [Pyxidicoccus parkwaysis]QSQ18824.1 SMI1/KNR4 family protein [Pyxidicoccus parkwaysis]
MGGKQKPPALGGLAAAFQKAGLATKEQAERVEAEKQARDQDAYRASLGLRGPAVVGAGSYREQIASINAWFADLLRREPGFAAHVPDGRTLAVSIEGAPATSSEVSAAERALGFALPPSFAAFLLEVGSVSFLGPWNDTTTPVTRLVAASASLDADVALTSERFVHAVKQSGVTLDPNVPRRLLHVSDDRNGEAVFALCSQRDASGEAPVFMRFHDEPDALYDASADFRQWVSVRLARLEDELQEWLTREARR